MLKIALAHAKGEIKTFKSRLAYLTVTSFILISFLVALIFASEYCLRWYYRDVLSSSHGKNYFYLKSNNKFYKEKNALGTRGKYFEITSNHALRVAVLGDSLAYGQGVWPYTKRFPEQTLKLFQEKYPNLDLEIINLGVPGLNLPQYIRHVSTFVKALKPDFVLYQWYTNDMDSEMEVQVYRAPPLISNQKLHIFLTENSVLYFLIEQAWSQLRIRQGKQMNYTEYLSSKFKDPASKDSIAARKLLNKLLDILDKEEIKHGIVLFPSFAYKMKDYPLDFLHNQVLDVCEERNLPCLDLRNAYSKHDEPLKGLWANTFDAHPGELAHKVAAEEIFIFFGQEWADSINEKLEIK